MFFIVSRMKHTFNISFLRAPFKANACFTIPAKYAHANVHGSPLTLYQQSGPEEIQAIALATGDHGAHQFLSPGQTLNSSIFQVAWGIVTYVDASDAPGALLKSASQSAHGTREDVRRCITSI